MQNKVYFITHGCSANYSDSEVMQGLLKQDGYKIFSNPEEADIIIINTCSVKNATENLFMREFKKYNKKPLVIAGCIAQAVPERFPKYSLLGTCQIHRVVEVVKETLKGNVVVLTKHEKNPRLNLPKIRKNPIVEILSINQGCTNFCSFCQTKIARGNLMSYDKKEIIKQAQCAIKDGVKEIWITSQDTGAYGKDIDMNLTDLLKDLVNLEGNFMIRLGMANPHHIIGFLEEFAEILQHPKMFRFVHIPVQSGNNNVLKKMLRGYSIDTFVHIIGTLRKAIPEITIATDVICGFPTETEAQFKDTINIIQQIKPDVLNISRYSSRPKTAAARMQQLSGEIIKSRSRYITAVYEELVMQQNKRWLGWKGKIIIDDFGKGSTMQGRNYSYKPVVIKGKYSLGTELEVEIINTTKHDLRAKVLD